MKNVSLVILSLMISLSCGAQTKETKYYRSSSFDEEVAPERAKYSKTTIEDNGMITTTTKNLKKNQIEYSETLKNDEPFGTWVIWTGKGPEELDFNFDVVYNREGCVNTGALQGVTDYFANNEALEYIAPKIEGKNQTMYSFLTHVIRYPAQARRNGLNGKVELAFSVTKEGEVKNIVVTKGAHIVLDKEAVRVIRKLKFSSPPMLKGEPIEVCIKMPMSFKIM